MLSKHVAGSFLTGKAEVTYTILRIIKFFVSLCINCRYSMKLSRLSALAALMTGISIFSLDAAVKDLPIKTINGHSYYYYDVPSKETVYSLCHKLGISKEEMIRCNPAVADGLKAGMTLFFPVDGDNTEGNADVTKQDGTRILTHQVEKGETIYGIATKYGISTESLISQNPIVREGLKSGQSLPITIPGSGVKETGAENTNNTAASQPSGITGYIVKKKETFYSIANAHGISVAQLEAANPGVNTLKVGQVLNIPVAGQPQVATETAQQEPNSTADNRPDDSTATTTITEPADTVQSQTLSIAVVLPFMLNEENPSKSALRYTEFYKGLLLAADSLRNNGTPIHISAYDTEGSTSKVKDLLALPELKENRIIIAPDNTAQLAALGEFGRQNGIKIFNTFIVKDESYLTNPMMMQGNLPSSQMYKKAIDALTSRLAYSTPVILHQNGGANDKADFITELKENLNANGIAYRELTIDAKLSQSDLKALSTDASYTFIPTSSRQSDLNKLLPGLIEWRDENPAVTVKLFGYPEWTTFRGETLSNMHNLNTIVYSRFYTDDENFRAKGLENKFKQWYGAGMEMAVPRQGLLGFDTGMFLIKYLKYPAARYDGIQNGYTFISPDDAEGYYNDVLYFVNFRPADVIEKINL